MSDIDEILQHRFSLPGQVPVFLMGHSMGGGEILTFAAQGPKETVSALAGFLAESPFIGLAPESKPSFLKVFLGRIAGKLLPTHQMAVPLKAETVSRDPAVCEEYKTDPLCTNTGTLEGLAGMLDRAADLLSQKTKIPSDIKVFLGHGTGDLVTYYPSSKKWVEESGIKDLEFRTYDGWYHKLHSEPGDDKKKFADDIAEWCLAKISPSSRL
jgi:acylglycerol lipase